MHPRFQYNEMMSSLLPYWPNRLVWKFNCKTKCKTNAIFRESKQSYSRKKWMEQASKHLERFMPPRRIFLPVYKSICCKYRVEKPLSNIIITILYVFCASLAVRVWYVLYYTKRHSLKSVPEILTNGYRDGACNTLTIKNGNICLSAICNSKCFGACSIHFFLE